MKHVRTIFAAIIFLASLGPAVSAEPPRMPGFCPLEPSRFSLDAKLVQSIKDLSDDVHLISYAPCKDLNNATRWWRLQGFHPRWSVSLFLDPNMSTSEFEDYRSQVYRNIANSRQSLDARLARMQSSSGETVVIYADERGVYLGAKNDNDRIQITAITSVRSGSMSVSIGALLTNEYDPKSILRDAVMYIRGIKSEEGVNAISFGPSELHTEQSRTSVWEYPLTPFTTVVCVILLFLLPAVVISFLGERRASQPPRAANKR